MNDSVDRIVGDSINVTMPEYVELLRIFQTEGEMSFVEDLNKCTVACKMLDVPLDKMIGKEWRVVVVNQSINKQDSINSTDIDQILERS